MIPGMASRLFQGQTIASAASVQARSGELFLVTGTTQINSISAPLGNNMNQCIYLIPTDGAVILGTSGNILVGITMAQNRVVQLTWIASLQKWVIENGV